MKKLIVKFVYFLIKFVPNKMTSFEKFDEEMRELANGEFYTSKVEKSTHSNSKPTIEFTGYIAGVGHLSGKTPEEALEKFRSHFNKELLSIPVVLD